MKVPKPVMCSVCGLALCAHTQLGQFVEEQHPHVATASASMTKEALPPDPPHTDSGYEGAARIELGGVGVNGSSSSNALPPGNMVTDTANLIARRRQTYYPAASMVFTMPPLPLATASASMGKEALPVEPPHTHVEDQGTARIELV